MADEPATWADAQAQTPEYLQTYTYPLYTGAAPSKIGDKGSSSSSSSDPPKKPPKMVTILSPGPQQTKIHHLSDSILQSSNIPDSEKITQYSKLALLQSHSNLLNREDLLGFGKLKNLIPKEEAADFHKSYSKIIAHTKTQLTGSLEQQDKEKDGDTAGDKEKNNKEPRLLLTEIDINDFSKVETNAVSFANISSTHKLKDEIQFLINWSRYDPLHENFRPDLYLSKFHLSRTYEELEQAKKFLLPIMKKQKEDVQAIVRQHFFSLIVANATVQAIRDNIIGTEKSSAARDSKTSAKEQLGNNAASLEQVLLETEEITLSTYGPLLRRRLHSERLRRVSSTIDTYRYAFELPGKLRKLAMVDFAESDLLDIRNTYIKTKKFIRAQNESVFKRKLQIEVNLAIDVFKPALYRKIEESAVVAATVNAVHNDKASELDYDSDDFTGGAGSNSESENEFAKSDENVRAFIHAALLLLQEIQPSEDHIAKIMALRHEKVLGNLQRIRGAGAAERVLQAHMTSANETQDAALDSAMKKKEETKKKIETLKNVSTVIYKLSAALIEGITFLWELGNMVLSELNKLSPADSLNLMIAEITTEYAEGVRVTLLPVSFTGTFLVSKEAAFFVMNTRKVAQQSLKIPSIHLGALISISEEVAEVYTLSSLRSMRIVAEELILIHPSTSKGDDEQNLLENSLRSLPKLLQLLIKESIADLDGLIEKGDPLAMRARVDCMRACVIAAQSMEKFLGVNVMVVKSQQDSKQTNFGNKKKSHSTADSTDSSEPQDLIAMSVTIASACNELSSDVIPHIGQYVATIFGGENFADTVHKSLNQVRKIEKAALEHCVRVLSVPFCVSIFKGILYGGDFIGSQVKKPRSYVQEVTLELALISGSIRSRAVSGSLVREIIRMLVQVIGDAISEALEELDLDTMGKNGIKQIMLDILFLDKIFLRLTGPVSFSSSQDKLKLYLTKEDIIELEETMSKLIDGYELLQNAMFISKY